MARLPELPDTKPPWTNKGPMWPSRTLQCGCWWLTREIELSNAVVGDITRPEPDSIRWNLPASKSDPQALGMARSHKCACGQLNGGPASVGQGMCPACNLWAQAAAARAFSSHIAEHPVYFDDDVASGESFPLFPTKTETFPNKNRHGCHHCVGRAAIAIGHYVQRQTSVGRTLPSKGRGTVPGPKRSGHLENPSSGPPLQQCNLVVP